MVISLNHFLPKKSYDCFSLYRVHTLTYFKGFKKNHFEKNKVKIVSMLPLELPFFVVAASVGK